MVGERAHSDSQLEGFTPPKQSLFYSILPGFSLAVEGDKDLPPAHSTLAQALPL